MLSGLFHTPIKVSPVSQDDRRSPSDSITSIESEIFQYDSRGSTPDSNGSDEPRLKPTGVSSFPRKLAEMLTPLRSPKGSSCLNSPKNSDALKTPTSKSGAFPPSPVPVVRNKAPMEPVQHSGNTNIKPMTTYPALSTLLKAARDCSLPPSRTEPEPGSPNYPTSMLALSNNIPTRMHRANWCLADYAVVEKLYKGYASTVYKAICKKSADVVVLKVYTLGAVCDLYKYQIYREVHLHSGVQHENIITMHASFQEGDKVVMVQEYADGADLFNVLHKYGGRMSERLAVQLVLDPFMRVLGYLHGKGVIHRDIKPENILFTKNMTLKLGDFGLAIDLREERAVTRAGTLDYMAPEVLKCPYKSRPDENKEKEHLHYGGRVDSWAVGVLAYELLTGFPPFYDQSRHGTEEQINNVNPSFPPGMSEEAEDFIQRSLSKNATLRPSIHDMLQHSWVDSFRSRRSMRIPPPGAMALQTAPSANSQASLVPTTAQKPSVSSSTNKLKEMISFPLPSPKQQANGNKLAPQPLPPHLASIKQAIAEDKTPGAVQRALAQYALAKKAMQKPQEDGTVSINVNLDTSKNAHL